MSTKIPVILGSTRGANGSGVGIQHYIAERLRSLGKDAEEVEPVSKFDLPFFVTHPVPPAYRGGEYPESPKVQAWSDYVKSAKVLAIVTAEYNGLPPANLKVSIDHLGPEYKEKPIAIFTYGMAAAGARCGTALVSALKDTLKADVLADQVHITLKGTQIKSENADELLSQYNGEIDALLNKLIEKAN